LSTLPAKIEREKIEYDMRYDLIDLIKRRLSADFEGIFHAEGR
jgi:hypothetical protein